MKRILLLFIGLFIFINSHGQQNYKGVWSGIIYKKNINKGEPIHLSFFIIDNIINGYSREEKFKKLDFTVKKTIGNIVNDTLFFEQISTISKNKSSKIKKKYIQFILKYNDTTGYLFGRFNDLKNKSDNGKLILYQIENSYNKLSNTPQSHTWFSRLKEDLKNGYYSPMKREIERKEFKFIPIYFDHDKAEIKNEYDVFLNKMIRVVNGHTDLRIKVTGHTDSDGTDQYNIDLSKRRAKSLIKYFTKNGISSDKIEIDFKGEKEPVETNNTKQGKQKNRRVDFSFI